MSLNQYEQEMVADQLLDTDFLMNQMPLNDIHFQTHDGSFILSQPTKGESFEPGYMGSYSESDQQPDPRSYSCSSTTSQSLSPTLHHSPPELYGLQITRPPFSTWPEQKSPSTTDPSKKESDDEDHRTVVTHLSGAGRTILLLIGNTAATGTKQSCAKGVSTKERP